MNVCFVGTGSIGTRHIKNLSSLCKQRGIELTIDLVRFSERPLDEFVAQKVSHIYRAWNEIDHSYDAIFIANPTFLHRETLSASQHISKVFFVEKPLVEDVCVLENFDFDLPRDNLYYVACPLRYTQALLRAESIIAEQPVFSARALSSSYLPDWRRGVDYREVYSAHKDQGGGVAIDLIHEWDYLVHLFGFPQQVMMMEGTFSDLEVDSEDLAIYLARYADKLVEVHLDYFGREPMRMFEFFTREATYRVDICHARLLKNGEVIESWAEDPNDKYLREMELFIGLITGQIKQSPNTLEDAVRVQRIAQGVTT